MGKSYDWLGICLLIYLHPGYTIRDLFSIKERNVFLNFTFIVVVMSDNQFDQIGECIYIRKIEDNPKHNGRLFCVQELIIRFNRNTTQFLVLYGFPVLMNP